MGFMFVRFEPGLPSVREMAAPYADELAAYRMEELVPQGRVTLRPRQVNWKNVADNYSDGMHIPVAHPGLTRLFGRSYGDRGAGLDRQDVGRPAATSHQQQLVGAPVSEAAAAGRAPAARSGSACGPISSCGRMSPSTSIPIRSISCSSSRCLPRETMIREIAYVHPDSRREMRAARYLNWRINRQVNVEDKTLIERVQAGMASSSYYGRAAERERSLPAQLRAAHAAHDSRVQETDEVTSPFPPQFRLPH